MNGSTFFFILYFHAREPKAHKGCSRHGFRDKRMKRTVLFLALAALVMPAFAQVRVGEMPIRGWEDEDRIPELVTNSGSYFYYFNWDDTILLIDSELQVRTIANNGNQSIKGVSFFDIDQSGDCAQGLPCSQSVFNNDDLWEFIVNAGEPSTNEYGSVIYKSFSVVQEDGNVLFTWSFDNNEAPANSNFEEFSVHIAKWNSSFYLMFGITWTLNGEYDYKTIVYRINQSSQNIERVEGDLPLRVFPTPASREQEITVELGDNSSATEIEVINTLGQTIQRIPVQPGQNEVKINTSKMGSGVHFVHGNKHKVAKIVVR